MSVSYTSAGYGPSFLKMRTYLIPGNRFNLESGDGRLQILEYMVRQFGKFLVVIGGVEDDFLGYEGC